MKVYSKQRDYYDSILSSFGEGDAIIYTREESIFKPAYLSHRITLGDNSISNCPESLQQVFIEANNKINRSRWWFGSNRNFQYSKLFLLFCGKLYPVLAVYAKEKYSYGGTTEVVKYFHTYDELKSFKDCDNKPFDIESVERFKNYFEPIANSTIDDYLISINKPMCLMADVSYHGSRAQHELVQYYYYENIILKDIGFQRVLDPYTCHQEIEMYLSNVLCANEKEVPQIDDEHLKKAKGFDDWSFKTPPSKKK